MKKKSVFDLLENGITDEAVGKKLYFKLFYKNIFSVCFYTAMLIFSIIYFGKIRIFSVLIFHNVFIGPTIYFLSLIFCIVLYTGISGYTFWKRKKEDKWSKRACQLYKKLDIPAFAMEMISILFFVVTFIFTPCSVGGDSMLDTYKDGDKLICSNLFYRPKRDDVIVFDSSAYVGKTGEVYIKRIIAIEGDSIRYNRISGILYVNDEISASDLTVEQYCTILESAGLREYTDHFVIPADRLMVFGDNRAISYDSRYFGLIDEKAVFGRVLFRLYPFQTPEKKILN